MAEEQLTEITTEGSTPIADGTFYYWIENDGSTDVQVTLTKSWLGDSHGSATATWTGFTAGTVNIAFEDHAIVSVIFASTGTIPTGSGSYEFTFDSGPQP